MHSRLFLFLTLSALPGYPSSPKNSMETILYIYSGIGLCNVVHNYWRNWYMKMINDVVRVNLTIMYVVMGSINHANLNIDKCWQWVSHWFALVVLMCIQFRSRRWSFINNERSIKGMFTPWPYKICDSLLNSSHDHFGLYRGKMLK